jgi:transcriptional regulator with GAF, ATPase, and Fis domain
MDHIRHDLNLLVAESRFREDLPYKLHVVPIKMPPLRELMVDIALLVAYLIDRFAKRARKKCRKSTRDRSKSLRHMAGRVTFVSYKM